MAIEKMKTLTITLNKIITLHPVFHLPLLQNHAQIEEIDSTLTDSSHTETQSCSIDRKKIVHSFIVVLAMKRPCKQAWLLIKMMM